MINALLSIFLVLATAPAAAQSTQQSFVQTDFSGGLNTYKKPLYLADNESPSMVNVLIDKNGSITKRQGFTKLNNTALGVSSDINAVYQFNKSNGVRYCVAFSSASGYYSTDGCQTFTQFVSTLTVGNDVNCAPLQDRLYCVNNSYNFYFNGTDDVPVAAMPADLDFIQVHRNRCFAAGNSTQPSRLFWSALGDCTSWTTATDWVDIDPEDGDVLQGIGEPLFDVLPLCKNYSFWSLSGRTPARFELVNISKNTGCKNHRSMANFENKQYFDSAGPNGGQPGIYSFNGIVLQEESVKLRNEIENIDTFRVSSARQSIDSKADYDAGTFDPAAMSTSRETGFIQSSYTAKTDTGFADGTYVNVSSNAGNGLTLAVSTNYVAGGNFPSTNPWWQCVGADSSGTSLYCNTSYNGGYVTPTDTGRVGRLCSAGDLAGGYALYNADSSLGPNQLTSTNQNSDISFSTITLSTNYSTAVVNLEFFAGNGANFARLKMVGTTPRGFYLTWTERIHSHSCGNCQAPETAGGASCVVRDFSNVQISSYPPTGSYTSGIFDTAISTPIWGDFTVVASSQTGGVTTLTYQVQSSTANDGGGFESLVFQSTGEEIVARQRRYLRWKASFTTQSSTTTPRINSLAVAAASTGTWTSGELFLSNNMSAWAPFTAVRTTSGGEANIAYAIKASTWAGGTAYQSFTAITPGSTPGISTGAYVVVMATHTVGVATETAKTDTININWSEGGSAKSASAKVYGGRYHYAAQARNGTENDVIYIRDKNGAWTKWSGLSPRFINVVGGSFIMGTSSTTSNGGYLYRLYDTDSDNGSAIYSEYQTKDYAMGNIANLKAVDRTYVIHSSNDSTLLVQAKADTGMRSFNYTLNLSTGAAFGIKQQTSTSTISGNTFRFSFGNNAASKPWEVLGFMVYFRDLGLMP